MSKRNILHVVNIPFVIPYYFGDQINYFHQNNYNIYIATQSSEKLTQYVKRWNFIAFEINIKRAISPLSDLISIFRLIKIIRNNNIDIVVGHTPKGALLAMISSFLSKVPKRIYFRHGIMYETSKGIKKRLLIFIEKVTSLLATDVLCVSNSVFTISVKYKLGNFNKLKLLNQGTCNGVDSENKFNKLNIITESLETLKRKLKIGNTDIVVGFVGRIARDKGVEELVEAWLNLIKTKQSNKLKLIICGPFDTRDPVSVRIRNVIQDEPSIIHVGEVENTEYYYSLFNIFILPSYREGFPTVVLEASSMFLPVITTKSTGCIDSIIENETGIFIEINSIDIYNKILFYIQNPEISKMHGIGGRRFVEEKFAQNIIWNNLLNFYK